MEKHVNAKKSVTAKKRKKKKTEKNDMAGKTLKTFSLFLFDRRLI